MLRTVITVGQSLILGALGIFLLTESAISQQISQELRWLGGVFGALLVAAGLVSLYLAAASNPLWRTYKTCRLETDVKKLRLAPAKVASVAAGYDTAEAAASAAIAGRKMKFSPDEAKLGEGFPGLAVRLDQLAAYTLAQKPESLFVGGKSFVFPVMVKGKIATSLLVDSADGSNWNYSGTNTGPLLQALLDARETAVASYPGADSFAALAVPALSYRFLSFNQGGTTFLTCLVNWPSAPIKLGETLPAAEALVRLQPIAAEKLKQADDQLGG